MEGDLYTSDIDIVVPIVMGGGDYTLDAPPHSFIDVKDFHTVQDLAEYMKYLISNRVGTRYLKGHPYPYI